MVILHGISACLIPETYFCFDYPYPFMKFRFLLIICLFSTLAILQAEAGINVVPPGGTVFVGEEQLDISESGIGPGGQIAWWAPGTSVQDSPADVMTVSNPVSFSALTSSFAGREGIWYSLADKTPVLKIKQPKLSVRIYDTTSDFDATGKWLPRGDLAAFQIETNLHEIGNRADGGGAPVDIIITSPLGSEYSAVSGPSGSFSLTGIPVRSASYDTGPVWNTGDADIGTYQIRAECTANRINSNNPDPGAGVSQTISVLIQGVNPLITGGKDEDDTEKEDTAVPTATPEIVPSPSPRPPAPVQPVSPPSAPVPVATPAGNLTEQAPLPSPRPSLPAVTQAAASPSQVPAPVPPSPAPTPRTPLSGLLAILATAGYILRMHR
jgi:hypothetical protein